MSRENGSPSPAGWYVIAGDGDVVLRVQPGMKLGEDQTGELCIAPAEAQLELGISADGGLTLLACGEHELELDSGNRIRRLDVSRPSRVQLNLVASRLSIATDFAGASHAQDVQVRAVRTGVSRDDLIVLPEPPAVASEHAVSPPGQASARRWAWEWPTAVVLGTIMVLAGLYAALPTAVNIPPSTGTQPATEAATPPSTGTRPATETAIPPSTGTRPATETAIPPSAGTPPATVTAIPPSAGTPPVTEPPQSLAAPAVLAESAPRLEPPSTPPVEPIPLPSARHRVVPTRVPGGASPSTEPDPASATEPGRASTARVAPASSSSRTVDWERLGEAVQAIAVARTIRGDLHAAADALERGLLVQPPEESAFTLYSRVLASDPDSADARRGLDSVRERLLSRAREQIAAEDVDAATTSLEDAARAGADPAAIDHLRSEVTYRRRLLDARAGRFAELYPITALKAIRQDAPPFPAGSATGIERSVEMQFTVNETGAVQDVEVLGDPPRRFARAATQAVRGWQFEPVLEHDTPMPVRTAVKITFRDR